MSKHLTGGLAQKFWMVALALVLIGLIPSAALAAPSIQPGASPLDAWGCDRIYQPRDCIIVLGSGLHVNTFVARGQTHTAQIGRYQVYIADCDEDGYCQNPHLLMQSPLKTIPGDGLMHGWEWDKGWDFAQPVEACAGFMVNNGQWLKGSGNGACEYISDYGKIRSATTN